MLHVGITPILNISTTPKLDSSGLKGLFTFKEFLNSIDVGIRGCMAVMNRVIRQDNIDFKNVFHRTKYGEIDNNSVDFFLRHDINIPGRE